MRIQIIALLIVLCASNGMTFGDKCSDALDLECLFGIIFDVDLSTEEITSEEQKEEQKIVTDLGRAVSNLSITIQNTLFENKKLPNTLTSVPILKESEANLKQVPVIVSYLANLTKVVKNVYVESSNPDLAPQHGDEHRGNEPSNNLIKDLSEKLKNEVSTFNETLKSLSNRIQKLEIDRQAVVVKATPTIVNDEPIKESKTVGDEPHPTLDE